MWLAQTWSACSLALFSCSPAPPSSTIRAWCNVVGSSLVRLLARSLLLLSRAAFLNKLHVVQHGWLKPGSLARSLSFSCSPVPPSSTSCTWCNAIGANLVRLLARSLFLLSRAAFLNKLHVVQCGWLKFGPLARSLSFPALPRHLPQQVVRGAPWLAQTWSACSLGLFSHLGPCTWRLFRCWCIVRCTGCWPLTCFGSSTLPQHLDVCPLCAAAPITAPTV